MGFFQALSFLTVIRTGKAKVFDGKEVATWGRYFFVTGLIIGAMAAGIDRLISGKMGSIAVSVALVIFIAVITGGLHLDGLADTFDAAFSMKPLSKRLEIMRESSIGAFGAMALVFVILLKAALIFELAGAERLKVLITFPAVSRGCMLLPAYLFDYPRKEGKGKGFVENMTLSILLTNIAVSAVVMYLLMQLSGLILLAAASLFTICISGFFNKRLGGVTGDVLGAVNELTEVFVLFFAVLY